ncbi:hypothetical protein EDB81DRAFT_764075 [Dactylonectria macrodidyma]|uniref:NmrA-like domain-containing protein n=1 Tax=Dactylonectria macrodidyma TaxID=307937 RepID=A0A9P9E1H6_9HYPO|nr:hypothetical protein EDB81DRAFT_764075 [Dactylonectria macrodidyma]
MASKLIVVVGATGGQGGAVVQAFLGKSNWKPAADKWVQLYPTNPKAGYPCLGDHRTNTGIFVQALVKNKPRGGTYVKCSVEDLTLESYLALWGRASGIAPGPDATQVIQVSPETYIKLFGHMARSRLNSGPCPSLSWNTG